MRVYHLANVRGCVLGITQKKERGKTMEATPLTAADVGAVVDNKLGHGYGYGCGCGNFA